MRVLYPGAFDIFHQGHINALSTARQIAGRNGTLIAAVNSDRFMAHYKREPARTDADRMDDVRASRLANEVHLWHGPEHQDEQILAHRPDVYVASADWLNRDLATQLGIPSLTWFSDHQISLLYVWRTPGISTTQLIQEGMTTRKA